MALSAAGGTGVVSSRCRFLCVGGVRTLPLALGNVNTQGRLPSKLPRGCNVVTGGARGAMLVMTGAGRPGSLACDGYNNVRVDRGKQPVA